MLTKEQKQFYDENGYLMVEDVITSEQLKKLQQITYALIEDSRQISQSNEVYDLDDGHNAETPRLTRIKLPHKQNPYYWDILKKSGVTEVLRDILGNDTTIITSKLNTKSPGGGSAVEWHQDWAFYPHTNDDLLA
ncbi:MAG: phytanoyl-CoA dioxygenase family protein, partial [Alphaproteobacteria bacterium]|nr:phytanoyl-CoA dioxygenase family protein [Alphaproteobacteria bacterium]